MRQEQQYARWLGAVLTVAVALDLCLALPMALHPNAMLSYLDLPLSLERPSLPRVGALLVLLAAVPGYLAAFDASRYPVLARFSIAARWAIFATAYVLTLGRGHTLSIVELAFALISSALLGLLLHSLRKLQQRATNSGESHVELAA